MGAGTKTIDIVDSIVGQSMRTLAPDPSQIYRDQSSHKPKDMSLFAWTLGHHPDAAHVALHALFDVYNSMAV